MNIVYLTSGITPRYYNNRWRIRNPLLNKVKAHILAHGAKIRSRFHFRIIDAFFEASLRNVGEVTEIDLRKLKKTNPDAFDVLVVHHRYDGYVSHQKHDESFLMDLANSCGCYKILYMNDDIPQSMYRNEVIDCYNLVIKREPYQDLSKYDLTDENRQKILPTLLGCDVFGRRKSAELKLRKCAGRLISEPMEAMCDLFFLGKVTDERLALWKLLNERFHCRGGLQPRAGRKLDADMVARELKYCEYLQELASARIALAIGGHGPFTFRHLEILALGGFMLCPDEIKQLSIPIPLVDGEHYISYSDRDDLMEKIDWYLSHDAERECIAQAGQKIFFEYYTPRVHGRFIKVRIQSDM